MNTKSTKNSSKDHSADHGTNHGINYKIRDKTEADITAISEVTVAAFKTLEICDHTEQFVIQALRDANALSLSLVAESQEQKKGQKTGQKTEQRLNCASASP